MAEVYRARDRVSGAPVAVKVLARRSPTDVERFLRELEMLHVLDHEGIVRPLHHGRLDDGVPFFVMEWLEGEDLETRLERKGPLELAEAVTLGISIASALGAAHVHGIVHRDVKPSNVLLVGGHTSSAKVIDFGVGRTEGAAGQTATGLIVGTPGYMSPEQARGDRRLDSRADVFALGCVLYECIAGAPPFVGDHPVAVLAKILMADAPRLAHARSGVPAGVDDLVWRMLAKNPDERPRDGAAVAAELAALAERHPTVRPSRPSTLTEHEQQVVSIVLVLANEDAAVAETMSSDQLLKLTTRAQKAITHLGALFEITIDGSIVCVPLADSPTDKAALAARCALALKRVLPARWIALATGRALVSRGSMPIGRVIDDAVGLIKRTKNQDAIVIDETTRSLLDARFDVAGDVLIGERTTLGARTVLGRRTLLVGRARELTTVMGVFEEALADRSPRAALIIGAPGMGKTRLAEELLLSMQAEAPAIWIARGDPVAAGSAFGIAGQLARSAIGLDPSQPADAQWSAVQTYAKRALASHEGIEEFLAELVRVEPPKPGVRFVAARADAMVMGDQLLRAFEDLTLSEARKRPVVVLVDDLQWGDLPSIKALDVVLRADDARLFVLALARPDVADAFPALWNERHVTRLTLGGLPRRAAEQLVRAVLGGVAGDAQVEQIVSRGEGVPFSLEELVRAEARGESSSTPDSVLAMAQQRLEGLDAESRHVLRAASVFGHRFWKNGVLALVGDAKARAVEGALDRLALAEVVTAARNSKLYGEHEYEFRHAIGQDAAYAMLTEADRQLGHRLAAEWLVDHGEREPMTLAVHAQRGADAIAASAWFLMAAEQALEGTDLHAAIERAEQSLTAGASSEARGNARRIQAEASFWAGDQPTARTRADEALALLDSGTLAWFDAALFALSARSQIGDATGMLTLLDTVRRTEPASGARIAKLQSIAVAAGYLVLQGQADLAEVVLAGIESDAMAASVEHPGALARFSVSRAILAYVRGQIGAYIEGTRNAAQLFLAAGEMRRELTQRANLAHALVECGAYAQAIPIAREVESGTSRLGLGHTLALTRQNLGVALAMQGDTPQGERMERLALEEFARGGHKRLEGACYIYLAQIALAAGDAQRAVGEAVRAVEVLEASPPLRPFALAVLADARFRAGDRESARKHAQEALELLDALGGAGEGATYVLLAAAETAEGEDRAALIVRGWKHVESRGKTLTDKALRESFFERVSENARLRDLAKGL